MHSVSKPVVLVLFAGLTIALIAVLLGFAANKRFPVDKIGIGGSLQHVDKVQLKQKIANNITGSFFSIHIQELLDAVEQAPWVKKATIKRVGLNRMEVSIQEHEALAYWNDNALLSKEGVVFAPSTFSSDLSLPKFTGNDVSSSLMAKVYLQLHNTNIQTMKVMAMETNERASWNINFENGITLTVGRSNVVDKVQQFYRVYQQHLAGSERKVASVDMRYSNGLAVQWGA